MRMFRAHTRDNPYLAPEFVADIYKSYSGKFAQQEFQQYHFSLS